jgi:multiple sugar transport system permease protein
LGQTFALVTFLQIIASFKVFGQIYLISGGGPGTVTRPIIQYIYTTAFTKNNLGYASAMSYALFLILIVFSLIQLRIQNKKD